MITVEDLCKSFKVANRSAGFTAAAKALFKQEYTQIAALKSVSFHINEGEIVGYIGPNGAGKSTTIKIMSGILVPDKGFCRIMGHIPWQDRIAYVGHIGVVFGQRSQLWWDVPVVDSFELLRDIYKVPPEKYRQRVAMLVESLDLGATINQPVRQLSLGQRMRCELAAALLHSPKILFLDEPTIGLDAVSKLAVRKFIKRINREEKVTVILTTHDLNDIEALADRIIMIGKGSILYDGKLDNLKTRVGTSKIITINFSENRPLPAIKGIESITWSAGKASLRVDLHKVTVSEVITTLAGQLEIRDITVESPPLEEVIVQLYQEFAI